MSSASASRSMLPLTGQDAPRSVSPVDDPGLPAGHDPPPQSSVPAGHGPQRKFSASVKQDSPPKPSESAGHDRATKPSISKGQSSSPPGESGCRCKPAKDKDGNPKPHRNLVVCIDGTSNQFGDRNTNVIELYSQLVKDETQLTYYNSGIGTYVKPSWTSVRYITQLIDNKIDLAIAWNFERIVKAAYRWLVENYQEGDRIFLFGFSRGAYQVRALAGMIEKVGLIYKGNDEQIPFAYELYVDPEANVVQDENEQNWTSKLRRKKKPDVTDGPNPNATASEVPRRRWWFNRRRGGELSSDPSKDSVPAAGSSPTGDTKDTHSTPKTKCARFKDAFSRDAHAHFTGAWDTVSSVGLIRGKTLPGTDSLDHICYFRHALALDERRVKFLPEFARGGSTEPAQKQDAQSLVRAKKAANVESPDVSLLSAKDADEDKLVSERSSRPRVKEVWFPGTHSDVGGGNAVNNDLDRRHPSFLWMSFEAITAELKQNHIKVDWKIDEIGHVQESLTWPWRLFECIPWRRLAYKDAEATTIRLHLGRGRKILAGQKVHASVAFCKDPYSPKATLSDPSQNRNLVDLVGTGSLDNFYWTEDWKDLLEMDIFDLTTANKCVETIVESSSTNPTVWVHRLKMISSSYEGCHALQQVQGADQRLIDAVQDKSPQIQAQVVDAVLRFSRRLTAVLDSLPHIFPNSIGLLTALRHRDWKCRLWACNFIIGRLTAEHFRQEVISERDILSALLARLVDDDADVAKSAGNAVIKLMGHEDSRPVIQKTDAFPDLCAALQHSSWSVRQNTSRFIGKMARHDDLRARIAAPTTIAALLARLSDDDSDVVESVVDAVTELTKYGDSQKIILTSNTFSDLCTSLGHGEWGVRQATCSIIAEIVKHDGLRPRVLKPATVAALLKRLSDSDTDVVQSAIGAVAELAQHDDSRKIMLSSDVFVNIRAGLERGDNGDAAIHAAISSCNIIKEFAKHDDLRPRLLEPAIFTVLLARLSDMNVVNPAIRAVTELAHHDDSRRKILLSDTFSDLSASLKIPSDDSGISEAACNLIAEMAKYDELRPKVLEPDTFAALIARLSDQDSDVVRSAIVAVTEMMKYDDLRGMILTSDIGSHLCASLGNHKWKIRQYNCRFIAELARYEDLKHIISEPVLKELRARCTDDDDDDVREAAKETLSTLAECGMIPLPNDSDDLALG